MWSCAQVHQLSTPPQLLFPTLNKSWPSTLAPAPDLQSSDIFWSLREVQAPRGQAFRAIKRTPTFFFRLVNKDCPRVCHQHSLHAAYFNASHRSKRTSQGRTFRMQPRNPVSDRKSMGKIRSSSRWRLVDFPTNLRFATFCNQSVYKKWVTPRLVSLVTKVVWDLVLRHLMQWPPSQLRQPTTY